MPEQIVVERGAHPDEPLAMIDQQPELELHASQLGGRQPLKAFAQRRAGDGDRVDAVGPCRDHDRRGAHRPSTWSRRGRHARRGRAGTARRHRRRGDSPPAPRPRSSPRPLAQASAAANPRSPTWMVSSPTSSPVLAATAARVCERLCMSAPSTIMALVPFLETQKRTPGGHGLLGRCHAPIKSRQDIPIGDERHSESQSGQPRPTA